MRATKSRRARLRRSAGEMAGSYSLIHGPIKLLHTKSCQLAHRLHAGQKATAMTSVTAARSAWTWSGALMCPLKSRVKMLATAGSSTLSLYVSTSLIVQSQLTGQDHSIVGVNLFLELTARQKRCPTSHILCSASSMHLQYETPTRCLCLILILDTLQRNNPCCYFHAQVGSGQQSAPTYAPHACTSAVE